MADKFDLYETVTASIISAIEAGCAPWRAPWTGSKSGTGFPKRANGERYRGINVLMLWLEASERGYASPFWMTYKQAQNLGAQVKKGAKSTTVVKYGTFEREDKDTGETHALPYAKAYRVFNADQIEGLAAEFYGSPIEAPRDLGTVSDPVLDAFFAATGARIETSDDPRAYYNPLVDLIHMPKIETFHSAGGFYATLAHETTHWTGHSSRLDRLSQGRDKAAYAFEELVAEIGACLLCAELGLTPDFEQSGAYIAGWLEALQNDKRHIFKAASAAQRAFDLILDRASPAEQQAAA